MTNKMHLYFLARGRHRFVRWMRENLEDVFLPYDVKDPKTGKKIKQAIQLTPRKVELYEMTFPEQCLNDVLPLIPNSHPKRYKFLNGLKRGIAKLIGIKPLTKKQDELTGTKARHPFVGCHIIGTKKDKFKDGVESI